MIDNTLRFRIGSVMEKSLPGLEFILPTLGTGS